MMKLAWTLSKWLRKSAIFSWSTGKAASDASCQVPSAWVKERVAPSFVQETAVRASGVGGHDLLVHGGHGVDVFLHAGDDGDDHAERGQHPTSSSSFF